MTRAIQTCAALLLAAASAYAAAPTPAANTAAPVAAANAAPQPQGAGAESQPAEAPPGQGYTYNPEGRRDPFVSLTRRGTDTARSTGAPRPAGLGGMAVGEITLRGTLQSRTGYVALVQGADNKTYVVKAGDRLLDGSVRTITADTMVIVQQVNDPLSLERQREVRKTLRQTEEVK